MNFPKEIKIAIQKAKNEDFFTYKWLDYCKKYSIDFILVDAYSNDIIEQVQGCDLFLWHYSNYDYRDQVFAKQLLFSLETSGIVVFPDFKTSWHFDDKLGQKYLLEAIQAPVIPTFVFYDKKSALDWANSTSFPKVFKLRKGSGSNNVILLKSKYEAKKYIQRAFGSGFPFYNQKASFFDRIIRHKRKGKFLLGLFKSLYRMFDVPDNLKFVSNEIGYVYFQDFIENDGFDIRVVVIGEIAFALKRFVRKGDFRASGSGYIIYDQKEINIDCIKIAFQVNESLKMQTVAYDFIISNVDGKPYIGEISFGYAATAYSACTGYWDRSLNFHEGKFEFQEVLFKQLIYSNNLRD
ncbi:hypothetical protein [Algoriphagus sp.]|uniref:ATP-grasp domain-containing protein n=1 Tax=Algoriphagus sp. TaxID=1872435 RepID=UPI00260F4759|nr:hypothetical protein [Algoriphagus sp.]